MNRPFPMWLARSMCENFNHRTVRIPLINHERGTLYSWGNCIVFNSKKMLTDLRQLELQPPRDRPGWKFRRIAAIAAIEKVAYNFATEWDQRYYLLAQFLAVRRWEDAIDALFRVAAYHQTNKLQMMLRNNYDSRARATTWTASFDTIRVRFWRRRRSGQPEGSDLTAWSICLRHLKRSWEQDPWYRVFQSVQRKSFSGEKAC